MEKEVKSIIINGETAIKPYFYIKNKKLHCRYSVDKCVTPDDRQKIFVANGAESERVFVELKGDYTGIILNCMGEQLIDNLSLNKGVNVINIPIGGLAILNRK